MALVFFIEALLVGKMNLSAMLEGDNLSLKVQDEVQRLHALFVSWFQGQRPQPKLQTELLSLLTPEFSHVAPNGQFLKGRQNLLDQLSEKYGCYQNRVFGIQIYNVQLLWSDSSHCLVTYEEWQSWKQDSGETHQFGRLSTALLARPSGTVNWQWRHVHETWLEASEPSTPPTPAPTPRDAETIMTGPVPRMIAPAEENSISSIGGATVKHKMLVVSRSATQDVSAATNILQAHMIPYDRLDGDTSLQKAAPSSASWPRLFLVSSHHSQPLYWGTVDRLRTCRDNGTLATEWQMPLGGDDPSQSPMSSAAKAAAAPLAAAALYSALEVSSEEDDSEDNEIGGDDTDEEGAHSVDLDGMLSLEGDESAHDETERTENENAILVLVDGKNTATNLTLRALDEERIVYKLIMAEETPKADNLRQISHRKTYPQVFLTSPSGVTTYYGNDEDILDSHANGRLRADLGLVLAESDDEEEEETQKKLPATTSDKDITFKPRRSPNSTLVVLYCSQSPSADLLLAQEETMLALDAQKIAYEKVDGTANEARRKELFSVSQEHDVYPQFFFVENDTRDTHYWGGLQDFFDAHQKQAIMAELGLPVSEGSHQSEEEDSSRMEGRRILMLTNSQKSEPLQDEALEALTTSGLPYEVMDGSAAENRASRNQLFELSTKWGTYPQFFAKEDDGTKNITFWGFGNNFMSSYKRGTLPRDFGLDPPQNGKAAAAPESAPVENRRDNEPAMAVSRAVAAGAVAGAVAASEPEMSEAERTFMENSQGILQFEDEDANETDEGDPANENDESLSKLVAVPSPIPNDVSKKRHVSPKLEKYAKPLTWENALVGLSIAGFDIGTSQGPIGDEAWYKEIGTTMEEKAQSKTVIKPRRKLALPEMVFPAAHVALEGHGLWLSWDVVDALDEWASAHEKIAIRSSISNRGVAVMKSKDAALWAAKKNQISADAVNSSAMFHYDWTYSTPFGGKVEGGEWSELDSSGMRHELLTDQSIPILFFDEVVLYEDDLHDNGQVEYSVKLRVMPSCAYVLSRLWVRVDNVVVRLRETRTLVDFFGISPKIYRDVSWQECYWGDLAGNGLPTDIRSWHYEGNETPEWHSLLKRIPEAILPKGIYEHAVLVPNKNP